MNAMQRFARPIATFVLSLIIIGTAVAKEPYSAKRIHQVLQNAPLQRVITVLRRVQGRLPDHDGVSPLESACQYDRLEVVRLLLERGDMPNDAARARTSRKLAMWYSRHDIAGDRDFANQCMNLYKRIKPGATPDLIAACYANDKAVFTAGHRRCAGDAELRREVMSVCAGSNRNDFLQTLIALTGDHGDHGAASVTIPAVATGNLEGLRMLLDAGADPNIEFVQQGTGANSLVQVGARDNRPECIRLLVARGADINRQSDSGKTALHFAVFWRQIDIVKTLLALGADANLARRDGVTPLDVGLVGRIPTRAELRDPSFIAVKIARVLVDAGAAPSSLYAIAIRDIDLLKERVRISSTGPNQHVWYSPLLHLAVRWDNQEAVEWLIDAGAKLEAVDTFNQSTVLHEAAGSPASESLVEWLVRRGAAVNARNRLGDMPIDFAARWLNAEAIRVLVANGAIKDAGAKRRYSLANVVRVAARQRKDQSEAQERAKRCLEALGVNAGTK